MEAKEYGVLSSSHEGMILQGQMILMALCGWTNSSVLANKW